MADSVSRAPSFGSQKMELWTDDDSASTLVATIDAQSATSIVGSFEGMAQFSFTQTSLAVREILRPYFVKTNTSVTTMAYEDSTEADYYLGASYARSSKLASGDGKVLRFYWYGSDIEGTTLRTVIFGKCFVSGDSGNLDTSTATAASSPIQLFPIKTIADATFADFDADLVTAPTTPADKLLAGVATVEAQLEIPS